LSIDFHYVSHYETRIICLRESKCGAYPNFRSETSGGINRRTLLRWTDAPERFNQARNLTNTHIPVCKLSHAVTTAVKPNSVSPTYLTYLPKLYPSEQAAVSIRKSFRIHFLMCPSIVHLFSMISYVVQPLMASYDYS